MKIFKVQNLTGDFRKKKTPVTYRYVIGYVQANSRNFVKEFETYEDARKELHYLNGGCKEC